MTIVTGKNLFFEGFESYSPFLFGCALCPDHILNLRLYFLHFVRGQKHPVRKSEFPKALSIMQPSLMGYEIGSSGGAEGSCVFV